MYKVKQKQFGLPVMILLIMSIFIGSVLLGGCTNPIVDPIAVQEEETFITASKGAKPPERSPVNLTVDLHLKTAINNQTITRYISFYKPATTVAIKVPITFMRKSSTYFIGSAYKADPNTVKLKSLSNFNNRDYWDDMKFENLNGSLSLDISSCEVRIWYNERAKQDDPITYLKDKKKEIDYSFEPLIARKYNFKLGPKGSATSRVNFNNIDGRLRNVIDFHRSFETDGWSILSFQSLRKPVRMMIQDLGKSGTNLGDQSKHIKYGTIPSSQAGCNETIEWYYHELRNDYSWYNNEFLHTSGPKSMAKIFLEKERLYVWDKYNHIFKLLKKNSSGVWYRTKATYTPQSGDYLVKFEGSPRNTKFGDDVIGKHAMMVLSLMKKGEEYRMNALEMWDPVKIREKKIDLADKTYTYCVGRMD